MREWIRKSLAMNIPSLILVIGGAASGKSAYAEQIVNAAGRAKVYVATARIFDDEMREKVADHVTNRGPGWRTIEAPTEIETALQTCAEDDIALLDCATMWLTNVMMDDADLRESTARLLLSLENAPCPVVVVTNEVGHGIVPENKLARSFREAQGRLNQQLAAQADRVILVTAGLPLALKGALPQ